MNDPTAPPPGDVTAPQSAEVLSKLAKKAGKPGSRSPSGQGQVTLAQGGLSFRRLFSHEGIHPFDEVTWEVRDSVIGNEKGVTVFEQLGVEVPSSWSQMATNVVVSKYFRGPQNTPRRETSVRQVIGRVCDTIARWGREGGYFRTEEDAAAFNDELTHLVLHQKMAFNSPVWFNVGVAGTRPQASACFINSVEDTMDSILKLAHTEGMLFKYGSGTGTNLSPIRSSAEMLAGGGTASGPVSFMKGFDAFAGVIKSGGTTRRAAKMVMLNSDHPDIEEFITCKVTEERKAWALIDAGYDGSFTGEAYQSIFFQNSNNSVRVSDDFMRAVIEDKEWQLRAVTNPEWIIKTLRARELLRLMAESAHHSGDPGIQYDTTINDWHTSSNTARINGSNPCFPGDARVHTTRGLVPIRELYAGLDAGHGFQVYTHRATAGTPGVGVVATTPVAIMETGVKPIVSIRFSNGQTFRCTPNHRLWTNNRGYVHADDLTTDDRVMLNDHRTPATAARWELPVTAAVPATSGHTGAIGTGCALPERWTVGLAEVTGHLVGGGWLTDAETGWAYGGEDVADGLLNAHRAVLTECFGGDAEQKVSNGTVQLRVGSAAVRGFFRSLGVSGEEAAAATRVPAAVFSAPADVQSAFLRGLFGADGCISMVEGGRANGYVGLGSRSSRLLQDVQQLLTVFGIRSRITPLSAAASPAFHHTRAGGQAIQYMSTQGCDLRIAGSDIEAFALAVGFPTPRKQAALNALIPGLTSCRTDGTVTMVSREADGHETVYNLTEPLHHSYIVEGVIVANCSEYMYLDDSACNLASLNLMHFLNEDGTVDIDAYRHAIDITITAQEILVSNASYPTPRIAENSEDFRPLGLGYANLGAMLMARGLPYDSPEGRDMAACMTAIMTGEAYAQSARIAREIGPFSGYAVNRQPMLRVIGKHREAAYNIGAEHVEGPLITAARKAWDEAHELGAVHGYRNGQTTVLAPTGCLVGESLVMTSRGLARLRGLGDPGGEKWQDLDIEVATDEGPRAASKYFINGTEPVMTVVTQRGYQIQGTTTHRIKVLAGDGTWEWRRFADVRGGDRVPIMIGGMVGEANAVALPPLPEANGQHEHRNRVPRYMTAEFAELLGYFMGDGSADATSLHFRVGTGDDDVIERLCDLGIHLFGMYAECTPMSGCTDVAFHSVRLALWWEACGFGRGVTGGGVGGDPGLHVPDAVLGTNNRAVYAAFVRGLFEADDGTGSGYPSFTTATASLGREVQTVLLAIGFVTTCKIDDRGAGSADDHERCVVRLLNASAAARFGEQVGFISRRKRALCAAAQQAQAGRYDQVPVTRRMIDALGPRNDRLRRTLLMSHERTATVSRHAATQLLERTADAELEHILTFFYDEIRTAELGGEQFTYDISVPDNVTYVANGFVSHNTIGFMMDCDTTGVEPDIALVKYKKLVGGGMLKIVNQTVPMALKRMGYGETAVADIIDYIDKNDTVEGAPHLREDDVAVFDCAFKPANGDRSIAWQGHVRMMAAAQPFLSGAISKTVNMPESASVEDVEKAYIDGWRKGLKALAIYRDGSKRSQPMATSMDKTTGTRVQVVERPLRRKLPGERQAITHRFEVAGHEGYITVGLYEDGLPGEIFLKMAKEGSTVSGLMDSFAVAVSMALQYGVPLKSLVDKLSHTRFDPQGFTKNPEIPIAKSVMDYVFRWLGSRFLDWDDRDKLGILRRDGSEIGEQPIVDPRVRMLATPATDAAAAGVVSDVRVTDAGVGVTWPATGAIKTETSTFQNQGDAPSCSDCGSLMVRSGACYKCHNCGATSGCS